MNARNPKDRFLEKVHIDPAIQCWLWTGPKRVSGGGSFHYKGGPWLAHRAAWELFKGEIPADTEVWHSCQEEACVNPAHLYLKPITRRDEPIELSDEYRDKFWRDVNMTEPGCWPWRKYKDKNGFGIAYVAGTAIKAHRAAWEIARGPVPDGERVYHSCEDRSCCQPAHLYTMTPTAWAAQQSAAGLFAGQEKTACANGHEFTPENTYITSKGKRACKQCNRIAGYKRYTLKKTPEAANEPITHLPQARRADSDSVCKYGHEYTPENTYTSKKGKKICKTCGREKDARRQLERKQKRVERGPVERKKPPLKTHCKHGHEFTPENTRIVKKGAGRACIICSRNAALMAYRKANPVEQRPRKVL